MAAPKFHCRNMMEKFFSELILEKTNTISDTTGENALVHTGDFVNVFEMNEWQLLTGRFAIIEVTGNERSLISSKIEFKLCEHGVFDE